MGASDRGPAGKLKAFGANVMVHARSAHPTTDREADKVSPFGIAGVPVEPAQDRAGAAGVAWAGEMNSHPRAMLEQAVDVSGLRAFDSDETHRVPLHSVDHEGPVV
ncbi:MAG: hypothetical protein M3Y35_01975 [Actinomycetota bacterium]|nr:hypothetical protein [Actinomycetota bacterium]